MCMAAGSFKTSCVFDFCGRPVGGEWAAEASTTLTIKQMVWSTKKFTWMQRCLWHMISNPNQLTLIWPKSNLVDCVNELGRRLLLWYSLFMQIGLRFCKRAVEIMRNLVYRFFGAWIKDRDRKHIRGQLFVRLVPNELFDVWSRVKVMFELFPDKD